MSLLLEALKKAALEKQSRTQSSSSPAPVPTPALSSAPSSTPSSTPRPTPSPAQTTAAETADTAIQEVIDQSAEAFEPAAIAVNAQTASEADLNFNDTLDQEAEIEAITEDHGLADDWDEIEELDVEVEEVENFDFESVGTEPEDEQEQERESVELVLEETEHGVNIARLQQETLRQAQKDEKDVQEEKARELAEIETQRTSAASRQQEERNRQSLDQLIASGKTVVRRSKRRSAFLYAMLVMTALGGILSYYFYLLANSGIAELQQPQVTEASIDIAEIIEATELNALEIAQVSGAVEQPLDTTGNAALQGRIDKNDQTIKVTAIATQAEPRSTKATPTESRSTESRPTDATFLRDEPVNTIAQRADVPPPATNYLNPTISIDKKVQPTSLAERVIIHHPQSSNRLSEILQSAYRALQQRELQKASTLYDQALAVDANQRDALLGAAATATARGRFDDAATYYQRRLNADPRDNFAQAGLLALMNNGKSRAAVQREVATLLAQSPKSSHLHFLKGVGFASEGRWNQAQSAFYEAYRLDNSNPDYAFNLAVSLDHLSQPSLARVYYERALSLANTRTANFDVTAIQQRLLELSQP
jgi:tetratricopeptide (TPR) repeat protein